MVKKAASSKAPKRQGTGHTSDILTAIDEKFEEIEETIVLASLVPQLHERLHAVEQILKIQNSPSLKEAAGSKWKQLKEEHQQMGPKWGDAGSPKRLAPPDDEINSGVNIEENSTSDVNLGVGHNGDKLRVEDEDDTEDISDLTSVTRRLTEKRRTSMTKITDISKSKITEMDEKTLDTQTTEYYTFGESTWDLVVFIGTGALGPFGSFQTVLLAVVNVLMQVVFCAIAWYNFTEPDINDGSIIDTLRWRRSSGHSYGDYSTVAKESLVHRVCKMDKSLASSGIQVDLVENINKYLKLEAEGLEGFFTGQILCIVALICWYLMVAKEVSHALALHRGIMATPRGPTKLDTRENPFTQAIHYRLRSVARRRKVFSGLLLLYRLVAAVLLIVVGTSFLVYTVNVTELILNAVALGIILDIDDLLFDALATTPGRHLVHQLDPLFMPSMPRIRGADAKSVFMSIFIPALTLFVYYSMLDPFVTTLTGVKTAMCGGNQNFVWSMDKRRITHLAPTFGGGWEIEEDSIKTDAIVEGETIGYGLAINNTRFGVWVTDVTVLSDMQIATLDDLIENENPRCEDLGTGEPLLNYLRYLLGNESIQSCADAAPFCGSFTKMPEFAVDGGIGWSARMLCSETCGCRNPGGELINVQGCPYSDGQCKMSAVYQEYKAGGLCIEKNASTLRSFAPWKEWIKSIRSYGMETSKLLGGKQEALILAQAMEDNGCGFLANLSAQNMSLGGCFSWNSKFSWDFKTLEVFCPVTCGCAEQNSAASGCPEPFGMSCDHLKWNKCLTWNGQHLCPGFNTKIIYALIMYNFASTDELTANRQATLSAFQQAVAQYAGHTQPLDPELVVVDHGWNGVAYVQIYLPQLEMMNSTEMTSSILTTPIEDYQVAVNASLTAAGVSLDDLGIIITHAGDPAGPSGSYGYNYGPTYR